MQYDANFPPSYYEWWHSFAVCWSVRERPTTPPHCSASATSASK